MAKTKKPSPEVACGPCGYTQSAEDKKRAQKWEAEDDIRTLQRANEIRQDAGRLKRAKAEAQRQLDALKKATD